MHNSLCKLFLVFVNVIILSSCAGQQQASHSSQSMLIIPGFEEPLIPIGTPANAETKALKVAIDNYFKQTDYYAGVDLLNNYIAIYPDSVWRVSLQLNMGLIHYRNGAFSEAINSWEGAWKLGKSATGLKQKAMVDRVYGELVRMYARLGRIEQLDALLLDAVGRPLTGSATEMVAGARDGLWMMKNEPGISYLCGPYALRSVLHALNLGNKGQGLIAEARSSEKGFSLAQVNELANKSGMNYQMVKREGTASLPLPAIVHWKVNHYAAVIGEKSGYYHVKDATFGDDLWVPKDVLDRETSGYFLISKNEIGQGWLQVASIEANKIYGKGSVSSDVPGRTGVDDIKDEPACDCKGMAGYNVHSMLVSLNITDTPLSYSPPIGPAVDITFTYNQREDGQSATMLYSNTSHRWVFNWSSYIEDDPQNLIDDVIRYTRGGGSYTHWYDSNLSEFKRDKTRGALLVRTSADPIVYEYQLSDGSKEIYAESNGVTTGVRRIFLSQVVDSNGKIMTLTYDHPHTTGVRLLSLTDALGQPTEFTYGEAGEPYLITMVEDFFERTTLLDYDDATKRLISITDAEGMVSGFAYKTGTDFIEEMTTDYGTTKFYYDGGTSYARWLTIEDPEGGKQHHYRHHNIGYENIVAYLGECTAEGDCPDRPEDDGPNGGIFTDTASFAMRNTFYWDKKAFAPYASLTPPLPASAIADAVVKHWTHATDAAGYRVMKADGVLESIKLPDEGRVWYNYPGQANSGVPSNVDTGNLEKPSVVARLLDGGVSTNIATRKLFTQRTRNEYNAAGNITCRRDPLNTVQRYVYAANDIDVMEEYRKENSNCSDSLNVVNKTKSYTYGNPSYPHLPTIITEYPVAGGSGYTTTYTYTLNGQIFTSKNALNQTTTYYYDANGYLLNIEDANNVPVSTYTYDDYGRMETMTNAQGYMLTYAYDDLNRLTSITYPGQTQEVYGYNGLDIVTVTDRHGDVKTMDYDDVRNLTEQSINNHALWTASYKYYENGKPKYVIDGENNVTAYVLDAKSRVIQVQRGEANEFTLTADPVFDVNNHTNNTTNTYESRTSRLWKTTDALGAVTIYEYDNADRIKKIIPANIQHTAYTYNGFGELTQEVSPDRGTTNYIYDNGGRLVHKTDARNKKTCYAYDSINRLIKIDYGFTASATLSCAIHSNFIADVAYTYDQNDTAHGYGVGRLTHVVDSSGVTDYKYNNLGSVLEKKFDPVGPVGVLTTGYGYDISGELAQVTYPGGRIVDYGRVKGRLDEMTLHYAGTATAVIDVVAHQPFSGVKQFTRSLENNETLTTLRNFYRNGSLADSNNSLSVDGTINLGYAYDKFNNITNIYNSNNPGVNQSFEYDPLQRLHVATGVYGRYTYDYDVMGNRTRMILDRSVPSEPDVFIRVFRDTYDYYNIFNNSKYELHRSDRVYNSFDDAISYQIFTHDAAGNLTSSSYNDSENNFTRTLIYGDDNRLRSVTVE